MQSENHHLYWLAAGLLIIMPTILTGQVLRFAFLRIYWKKRGYFRLHLISGLVCTLTVYYFMYCFLFWQYSWPPLAMINAFCTVLVSFTGIRMIPLVKKKDIRTQRFFLLNSIAFAGMGFFTISAIFSTYSIFLGQLFALLMILAQLLSIYLNIIELYRNCISVELAKGHDSEKIAIGPLKIKQLLRLFKFNLAESNESHLAASRGGGLTVSLLNSLPLLSVALIGLLIGCQLFFKIGPGFWASCAIPLQIMIVSMSFNCSMGVWGRSANLS